jgi:hypothetical protein
MLAIVGPLAVHQELAAGILNVRHRWDARSDWMSINLSLGFLGRF